MPANPMLQQVQIAKILYAKTQAGEIQWEVTSQKGTFQVSFPGYAIRLRRRQYTDPNGEDASDYIFQLFNKDAQLVDEFDDNQLTRLGYATAYPDMTDLYESARRIALKVNEALDNVLELLESGKAGPRPPAKEEELPF